MNRTGTPKSVGAGSIMASPGIFLSGFLGAVLLAPQASLPSAPVPPRGNS